MEHTESKARRLQLSQRASNWIQIAVSTAALALVPIVYSLSGDHNRGFLLGNAETTVAGALACAVILGIIGARIIPDKGDTHDKTVFRGMIGTLVIVAGSAPLWLTYAKLERNFAVVEAYMAGSGAATKVGRMAEQHPEQARKIGNAISLGLMHTAFKDSFPEAQIEELSKKIDLKWKELGLDPADF